MLGPIFSREVVTVPRRSGHYPQRAALVGLLCILGVTTWQATIGFARDATLGETANFGLLLFQIVAFVQLFLTLFFATLSAAGAVSQEKDRRTFVLLLLTDLRDYEIVLGKLLGALLPILILLFVSVPVLALLLLLGGIDPEQVFQAVLVLFASAIAAGSLGGLVALWRDKTYQALALSVLFLVLYVCVSQGVGTVGPMLVADWDWPTVQAWVDPFVAMLSVLEPPTTGAGLAPAYGFVLVTLAFCAALNGIGIWGLRKWNPSGEPIMQRESSSAAEDPESNEAVEAEKRARAHAAPGDARQVWANPVLWREIRTLAYGRRPLLVKFAFGIVLALILYFAVNELNRPGGRPAFAAAYGLVPVAVLSLLLVAAQAVTSITSERDGAALDVLLVTDVSPKEFVFGKLLGVLYNTKEYIIPPLLLAGFYAIRGALARTPAGTPPGDVLAANFGPMVAVVGALIVLFGFATALGLHVSLRITQSRLAIGHTLGTVFFLSTGTLISIYLIVINGGSFGNQWFSFLAFLVLGIGGLLYVLSADRPSPALTLASVVCPLAMFYCVVNVLIGGRPGAEESADPLVPFLALGAAFGFAVYAMLFPLVTEFDVALGRTAQPNES
ncbi:ABC transporter permease subunit [Gemmata sp. JC717]|uniref:ABC transporter permease subunit n=1 Tax=Gemmata algarum TaxID=2975278 RepID=A0ABU5F2Z0_9BACT|nr:ABC transporter permease subunit [Gemmata algarum]MDY3551739.1 ABC transporter permease subunit [Gemmata algarum]MDY3561710.1 ABC transporter permease subunit [Gemmata algarum]